MRLASKRGVIKSESHYARILITEGASYLALPGVKNHFLVRFAARKPAAQGKRLFVSLPSIYEPACAQNRAHADSTCWATFGPPLSGLVSRSLDD